MVVVVAAALTGLVMMNLSGVDASPNEVNSGLSNLMKTQITDGTQEEVVTPSSMPSMFKMLGALIVVIVCIYVGLFLLKKSMGKRYGGLKGGALEVLETTHIAPKKSVTLVRVADRAVLVGVTESQITVLTELGSEETAELMQNVATEQETAGFKQMFEAATQRVKTFTTKGSPAALEA